VRIGEGNVFREFVTVNRATAEGDVTQIGNRNLLMAYVHVAHDCIVRDDAILANSVNLAGHVEVDEHAVVGGVTAVHQFVHIGAYSIIGGESKVTKDMPPFFKAAGNPLRVVGPNVVGLDRNGFSIEVRRVVKEAFRLLYRSDLNVTQAIERIRQDLPPIPEIRRLLEFIKRSRRGITR
jgi:UDP-N-acetylglucosamine acyltransferase